MGIGLLSGRQPEAIGVSDRAAADDRGARARGSAAPLDRAAVTGGTCLLLGVFLVALGFLSLYALIALWPAVEAATAPRAKPATIHLLWAQWTPSKEVTLLLLVTFSSALGSSLHAAISFTDYVGNRRLARSWIWWYVLRTFVGMALAVLFYFALRGGLFSANTPTDVINPFGIAALSGMVGLFSKQGTDKLREIFDTMFRTAPGQGDDRRGDSIVNPRPMVGGAKPSRLVAGTEAAEVRVSGEGFIPASVVRVSRSVDGGGPYLQRETHFMSPNELRVRLHADDVKDDGTAFLTVLNPSPGGGESGAAEVEIHPGDGSVTDRDP